MEAEHAAETAIIRQAQAGCQEAYAKLYQRHLDAIQRYIAKRVSASCDAEDLTQTVFLKAWQALVNYQPSATPFRAWLYQIAHNTVIDHYRADSQQHKHGATLVWEDLTPALDWREAPETRLLDGEQRETIQRAIAKLRPSYQEIIVRRYLHEMDYSEIAADLGQQVNNLRVLQHRALAALRHVLAQSVPLALALALTMLLAGRQIVLETLRALPGDGLYPVRTVVEESALLLANDTLDIRLYTLFAEQRTRELSQLVQQERTEDLAPTAQNLADHIKAAAAAIKRLAPTDPAIKAEFATTLDKQAGQLTQLLAADRADVQKEIQPALDAIDAATKLTPSKESSPPSDPPATPVSVPQSALDGAQVEAAPAVPVRERNQPTVSIAPTSLPAPPPATTVPLQHAEQPPAVVTQSLPMAAGEQDQDHAANQPLPPVQPALAPGSHQSAAPQSSAEPPAKPTPEPKWEQAQAPAQPDETEAQAPTEHAAPPPPPERIEQPNSDPPTASRDHDGDKGSAPPPAPDDHIDAEGAAPPPAEQTDHAESDASSAPDDHARDQHSPPPEDHAAPNEDASDQHDDRQRADTAPSTEKHDRNKKRQP